MTYATVTLKLRTRSLKKAADIAEGAAEHLLGTFNDVGSLVEAWHRATADDELARALKERDEARALLTATDDYLRSIRSEELDGSEPQCGDLLDRNTAAFVAWGGA
jgi:hypothetical protein